MKLALPGALTVLMAVAILSADAGVAVAYTGKRLDSGLVFTFQQFLDYGAEIWLKPEDESECLAYEAYGCQYPKSIPVWADGKPHTYKTGYEWESYGPIPGKCGYNFSKESDSEKAEGQKSCKVMSDDGSTLQVLTFLKVVLEQSWIFMNWGMKIRLLHIVVIWWLIFM